MSEQNMDVLQEVINPQYPEGLDELSALLTFLPEEMRKPIAMSMIESFLSL